MSQQRRKYRNRLLPLIAAPLLMALAACTTDYYDKGEGEVSQMQADLVEVHTDAAQHIDYVLTDDGERLTTSYNASWANKVDTLYRAALYYKRADGSQDVETRSCSQITLAHITPKDSLKRGMKIDPVKLESVWMAKTKRYLNTSMYLKVGESDVENAKHHLGIIRDTIITYADNTKTTGLTFYHDQGQVPEYYSQRIYFSVPIDGLTTDSVRIRINTYNGVKEKTFALK